MAFIGDMMPVDRVVRHGSDGPTVVGAIARQSSQPTVSGTFCCFMTRGKIQYNIKSDI